MHPSRPDPLRASIVRYGSSSLALHLVSALTAYLRPLFLSPQGFGFSSILALIRTYAGYTHLGSRTALRYLLPRYGGLEGHPEARQAERTVYAASLGIAVMLAAALAVSGVVLDLPPELPSAFVLGAPALVAAAHYEHRVVVHKGLQRFRTHSHSDYLLGTVTLGLTRL